MRFSSLTDRISGKSVDSWEVHYKAAERLNAGDDIYLLSVGQESYEYTDSRIVESAIKSLKAGRHHYTPVEGEYELRRLIALHHKNRTGQDVDADNCVVFVGAQNGIFAAAQCLLESGDEVIIPEPYYTTYPATFTSSGAILRSVPCRTEDHFQVNVDGILAAINEKTKAIVLNSPNNPTGAVYEKDRIAAIVKACVDNETWLICDDVYADLVDPQQLCCAASIPGADQVVVTVSSLSKSHRMTGWRLGWAIAPKPLVHHFYNLNMCMNYGLVGFVQDAAVTAFELSNEITPKIRANINHMRNVLSDSLSKIPALKIVPSNAGMFVMLDIRDMNISGQEFCQGLLDKHDVGLIPCDGFGESGVGLIRVSACDSPQRLEEASRRIGDYVKSLA